MFNVNQITSQLARMPDQALQQYAMLHKNDPYTVSLALAESNRRKEMRAGAAPMPGQMPKVVDQDIAQMVAPQQLPENVGIGQLPAKNIQGMADGGIVGYSGKDDDQVVRNPYAFLNPGDMWDAVQRWRASGQPLLPYLGIPTTRTVPPTPLAIQTAMQNLPQSSISGTGSTEDIDKLAAQMQATKVTKPPVPPTGGLPTVPPKTGAVSTAPTGGISALPSEADAIERFKKAIGTSAEPTVNKEDFLKELSDISKPAYDKANALVEKEKATLKEGREQDFYMALIQGGLAAASEAGPNAIQNIAKGFEKGAANYSAALKDFRKASQENAKMELELARAQAADKKGDLKAYYDHQDKALERQAKKDERIAAGISSIITTTEHGKYALAAAETSGRYHVAGSQVSANAQRALMEALGTADQNSPLRKGFDLMKLEGQIQKGYEAWQTRAYDKTTGMPNEAFIKMYPTPDSYIQDFLKSAKAAEGTGYLNIPNPQATGATVRQR